MYEIVVFSSGTFLTDQPLTQQLDPYHFVSHFLYRDATLYQEGRHIKDLSKINRDLARVIVIEDNPEEVEFHRENVLAIKSFQDVHKPDDELDKLGDFLEDLFMRDVQDVRVELATYAERDVLEEYTRRKRARIQEEQERMSKGLGGLIRRQWHH